METSPSPLVTENDDSADDVFTSSTAQPSNKDGTETTQMGTASHEDGEEEVISGGSSYLPSHPEPVLPEDELKIPPVPISISDENYQRGNWGTKLEYLAVMTCQVVTISIYSFSYYCYKNGGLIFVIPYILALFFFGLPLILLAISIGQFTSSGFFTLWRFTPIMKGISVYVFLQILGSMLLNNYLLAQSFTFLFVAIGNPYNLPWADCSNHWNSEACRDDSSTSVAAVDSSVATGDSGMAFSDDSLYQADYSSSQAVSVRASVEYYQYMFGSGNISTMAVIGALAALFCLLHATILGIKVVGKVTLCALAGIFVLTVLFLVRSVTLPGAGTGYLFLFLPNLDYLLKATLWIDAIKLVYLNLTFAFWPMAGLASHNRFHNNCFLDSALLIAAAIFAPLLLSISIFCCYGFFAQTLGVTLSEVIQHGVQLWFVVIPDICSQMPISSLWCVIWFGLLCLTLLGNQMGLCISVVSSILDLLGWVHGWRQAIPVTLILCLFIFVSTVVGIFVGGSYLLVLDYGFIYLQTVPLALFCISVVWFYGGLQKFYLMRFAKDVESMVGFFPVFFKGLFTAIWGFVIPFLMAAYLLQEFISAYNWFHLTAPTLIFMGVSLLVLIIGVILGGLHEVWKHKDVNTYFTDYFYRASLPLPDWGPALEDHRSYAGYLPTGFTPQPYRIGQRPYLPNVEDPQPSVGKPEMDPNTATLPAATPLLGLNLVSTETTL